MRNANLLNYDPNSFVSTEEAVDGAFDPYKIVQPLQPVDLDPIQPRDDVIRTTYPFVSILPELGNEIVTGLFTGATPPQQQIFIPINAEFYRITWTSSSVNRTLLMSRSMIPPDASLASITEGVVVAPPTGEWRMCKGSDTIWLWVNGVAALNVWYSIEFQSVVK